MLSLCLFSLLASPFGVRTYLDVQAAQRAAAAQQLSVIDRPAIVSARTSARSVRPFDQPQRAALDGVRGKGAWFMIFASDWTNPDADRAWDMVDAAVKADLSHIYVRVADSRALRRSAESMILCAKRFAFIPTYARSTCALFS